MKLFIILFSVLLSSEIFAQMGGTVGALNQLEQDPARKNVQGDTHKLRKMINDLDEPREKPLAKTPNQIKIENEQKNQR